MSTFHDAKQGGRERLSLAAHRARPGEHLCSFHASDRERAAIVCAFVQGALGAGERVFYVANEQPPEQVARLLTAGGVHAEALLDAGQLVVRHFGDVYGSPDLTDVRAVLARYAQEADRSRADGYPGLRVAVEMGDFVGALGSVEAVAEWERTVTDGFGAAGIAGMCQYDERVVGPGDRARIAAAHPSVATADGAVPLATFTATASRVVVAGELDRSNAHALGRVLRARAATTPRVELDLERLAFADLAAIRTIFEVADELPSGSAVLLRDPPPAVARLLDLIGWRHERVRVERT